MKNALSQIYGHFRRNWLVATVLLLQMATLWIALEALSVSRHAAGFAESAWNEGTRAQLTCFDTLRIAQKTHNTVAEVALLCPKGASGK